MELDSEVLIEASKWAEETLIKIRSRHTHPTVDWKFDKDVDSMYEEFEAFKAFSSMNPNLDENRAFYVLFLVMSRYKTLKKRKEEAGRQRMSKWEKVAGVKKVR